MPEVHAEKPLTQFGECSGDKILQFCDFFLMIIKTAAFIFELFTCNLAISLRLERINCP